MCVSEDDLADIFLNLQKKGAHNINLVTAEHFAPSIRAGILSARKNGLKIPIVLNTGGYMSEESFEILKDVTDIFLVDFKYMSEELSYKYSAAKDYPSVAKNI